MQTEELGMPMPAEKKRMFMTRDLTLIGMLGGITMLLGLTGYGFVQLPFMKATILHIPTIIGAILAGPRVGMFVGLIFGGFSLMQNIMAPTLMSFAFLNPLVSVVPRMLLGPFAYIVYTVLPLKVQAWRVAISAFLATLFHTAAVLGMVYVLYAKEFAEMRNIPLDNVVNILVGIAATNGSAEAVVSTVIAVPVVLMVNKIFKR